MKDPFHANCLPVHIGTLVELGKANGNLTCIGCIHLQTTFIRVNRTDQFFPFSLQSCFTSHTDLWTCTPTIQYVLGFFFFKNSSNGFFCVCN